MLIKTHLVITAFFILIFFSAVEHKTIFILTAFLATYIPDIDSRYSSFGNKFLARILQFFTKHRGIIHSFSFLILLTFLLVLFYPIFSLGFFLGYASHLVADSFTSDGIRAFYPFRAISKGIISTGGIAERTIFFVFLIVDLFLLLVI